MFCGHCAGEEGVGETGCQQGHVGQLVNRSFAASYKSPHHHHHRQRQRQRQRQRRRQRSRLNISHDIFDRFRLTRNKPTKHFVPVPPPATPYLDPFDTRRLSMTFWSAQVMANGIDLNEFWPCGLQLTVAPNPQREYGRIWTVLARYLRHLSTSIIFDPIRAGVKWFESF